MIARLPMAAMALWLAAGVAPAGAADLSCPGPDGSSCEKADVGFVPRYPDPATAPDYGVFIATLPGLGYLTDGDGDGSVHDEGCDPDKVSGLGAGIAALSTIVALTPGCNTAPENIDSGCFAAMTILTTALEGVSIVETQCGLQDGLVGGAEAEAAYENTKMLAATQLELSLQDCMPLGTVVLPRALGGRAEEVADLVRHRIDQMNALGATPTGVGRAEAYYAIATAQLQGAEYRNAYGNFCKAYGHLQHARR
jgi:hypothetical protein